MLKNPSQNSEEHDVEHLQSAGVAQVELPIGAKHGLQLGSQ